MRKFLLILLGAFLMTGLTIHASAGMSIKPGKVVQTGDLQMAPEKIQVIDGDSFQYARVVYDLAFIDAPEIGQVCKHHDHLWHCGLDAAFNLRKIFELEPGPVSCTITHKDGRKLADCVTGTIDLSEHLLLEGLVTTSPDAPRHYRMARDSAQNATLGIWRGAFIPPAKWRAGDRLPEEHKHDPNAPLMADLPWHFNAGHLSYDPETQHLSCIIKGKTAPDGGHIYYTPLDDDYADIPVNTASGDRVFCGDDDARENGFRHVGEIPGITPEPD